MSDQDDRIDDLLDSWEESFERGNDIPAAELCKDQPELLPILAAKIAKLRKLNGVLADDLDGEQTQQHAPGTNAAPVTSVQVDADFAVDEFIDGGGLGTVFSGRDRLLKRDAAIKFLRAPHAKNAGRVQQFKTECEITSRLDHPGIVPIYGHGMLDNGQPFYVMRRVSGETLKERAEALHQELSSAVPSSAQRVEFHSLLSTFVAVCQTIHYAHCRKVIHRDIKPANIMIGKHAETTVLDWGLATLFQSESTDPGFAEGTLQVTLDSKALNSSAGTPMYMSPEQHAGSSDVGPASDVYSLGATLLVLLSGEAPFEGDSLPSLRSNVLRGQAKNPKTKYRWMSPALLSICRKAMSVDPIDRYATAEDLAEDVERYLADEPVLAHRESWLRRSSRWMTRNLLLTFAIGTTLLVGTIGSSVYSSIVTAHAARERSARLHATTARYQSLRLAAGFAANSVALQINDRWRILEIITRDDELIEALADVEGTPDDTDWASLQGLLLRFKEEFHDAAGHPQSWFLCDASGRQVARVKPSVKSIGKNFAHRDYFHGTGIDAPPEGIETKHIVDAHRSKVYASTSDPGKLKVALSCPIWSDTVVTPDRKFLGILGISVSLGEFEELQMGLGTEQRVLVVDLEENVIDGESFEGLLLHHPKMREENTQSRAVVPPELLSSLRKIRSDTSSPANASSKSQESWTAELLDEFRDPLESSQGENSHWVASFAPVFVNGRADEIADTGWGVIVAELENNEPGFFGFELLPRRE